MRIGVDVVAVAELDRLHARRWFREHSYAREELALARRLPAARAREFLAGRYAAKEAVLKVLGTGLGKGIGPAEICVLDGSGDAPVVHLHGAAARRAAAVGVAGVEVSITHQDGCVIAVAVGGDADLRRPASLRAVERAGRDAARKLGRTRPGLASDAALRAAAGGGRNAVREAAARAAV
ncbi:4'-phosphopantetheinyl transferase superfamily protein [Streptomyces sp. NPDC097619]|uniref:holo-ACP synthase n=1 Tax=Streptomyces sp. NPDC097619 TaxID=3157228 RepID=UPI0033223A99